MTPLPHDGQTRGELVLRAPWLTSCYTRDGGASEQLWRGGWMHTEDVATIDQWGQVQIRDRLKDVVKTGGEWVDSIQLEELIATVPSVVEASVIAVADDKWGERPLAVIISRPGTAPTLAEINAPIDRAIQSGVITRYARIDRFVVIESLPRTSVGKIDKKALRAQFSET